jgi:4-amino-4-deoxy-L-arabinose transferase-like glycosyltransferase
VFGSGPLSYLILRYSLIAAIGVLFYVALRRTVASARLAASFSLSLVLFFWFGWESHHSVSHTLALLAASLALWIASLAYAERRTGSRGLGLGLVIGLGLMAKWSFLLVLVSLGVALAFVPDTRRIYTDPRTLLVLAGACLPMLPFLLWLAHADFHLVSGRAVPQGRSVPVDRALQDGLAFIAGIPLVFLPWIAIVLAFALRFRQQPSEQALPYATAIRLALGTAALVLGLMALILIGVTLSGATLFGITHFAIHYLFPFCLFAALGLAGLVAARVDAARFAPALAVTSLTAACAIFVVKLASFFIVPPASEATNLISYAQLAEELTRRGLGSTQFITLSPREAGNLAIYLPNARAFLKRPHRAAASRPRKGSPLRAAVGRRIFSSPGGAICGDARGEQVSEAARCRGQRGPSRGGSRGLAEAPDRGAEAVGVASLARQLGRARLPACGAQRLTLNLASAGQAHWEVRRSGGAGKTWRQSANEPLKALRSTTPAIPGTWPVVVNCQNSQGRSP